MFEYPQQFYNTTSAEEVIPYIIDLLQPSSVLDVGCGNGTWLKVMQEQNGINKVLGIDDPRTDRSTLLIPEQCFRAADLTKGFTMEERFDLVISLEVGEHLPDEAADRFVKSLTDHSDRIVFSAAIPDQGGIYHINEQWPEYWQAKFAALGFELYDVFRDRFWHNDRVQWWYRQNMFLYIRKGTPVSGLQPGQKFPLSCIHPDLFSIRYKQLEKATQEYQAYMETPAVKDSAFRFLSALKRKLGS